MILAAALVLAAVFGAIYWLAAWMQVIAYSVTSILALIMLVPVLLSESFAKAWQFLRYNREFHIQDTVEEAAGFAQVIKEWRGKGKHASGLLDTALEKKVRELEVYSDGMKRTNVTAFVGMLVTAITGLYEHASTNIYMDSVLISAVVILAAVLAAATYVNARNYSTFRRAKELLVMIRKECPATTE